MHNQPPTTKHPNVTNYAILAAASILSLGQFKLITLLVNPIFVWGTTVTGWHLLQGIADLRLPALALCLAFSLLVSPASTYRLPRPDTPWRTVGILAAATLILTATVVFRLRVWVPALPSVTDVIVLVIVAVLAEELWFRGAIFAILERTAPVPPQRVALVAVLGSAILFSLAHWQYHGFRLTGAALAQITYTLPLGIVFGYMRAATGSLWVSILVHMLVNTIAWMRAWGL